MNKLQTLISLCAASVTISINEHRDVYETVEEYVGRQRDQEGYDDISPEVLARMIETDTIIELQFYPRTPVAFCQIVGADLDEVLTVRMVRSTEQFDHCTFEVFPLVGEAILHEWKIPAPVSEVRELLGVAPGEPVRHTRIDQEQCDKIMERYFPTAEKFNVLEYEVYVEQVRDYRAYRAAEEDI